MSDWRLENKEGQLVWTSPSVPNGGQALHTLMSPTLILGCAKKGDALPVNYIKLPDVTRVSLSTPNSILLERRTGASILLVCNDGPEEAAVWLERIQRAVGGGGSLAATSASTPNKPKTGSAATVASAAAAAAPASPTSPSGTKKPVPKPADPSLTNIASALQSDLKSKPIAVPTATPMTTPNKTGTGGSAAAGGGITPPPASSAVDLPVVAADGGNNSSSFNNKPDPLSLTQLKTQNSMTSQMLRNGSNSNTQSSMMMNMSGTGGGGGGGGGVGGTGSVPTSPGGGASPLPDMAGGSHQPALNSTVHPSNMRNQQQQQQQQQQNAHAKSLVGGGGSQQQQTVQPVAAGTNNNLSTSASSGQFVGLNQSAGTTPNAGQNNNNLHHRFRPEDSTPHPSHPLAQTKLEKTQSEVVVPGAPGSSTVRPVVAPPLGSSVGRMSSGVASAGHFSSGGGGGGGGGGASPSDVSASGGSLGGFSRAGGAGGGGMADTLPDGSLMAAAHRRGMLVDLPATQSVNRSIAPNASAVWKEWRDPNGVLYVLHEGTGTMQRLMPGEDKFQLYNTDEELDRAQQQGGPDYHSPQHMEGDATLDMQDMTVHNLQHYGAAGAAQSGIPYPPVPSGNLMREMVVSVPRGQFSPTRRAQVEPLAVPRLDDQHYRGKRVHRFTLSGADDPRVAVVEHQVQSLDTEGMKWDPRSGNVIARDAQQQSTIGDVTLRRQWEHVKSVLQQGRYFKKHSFRKANQSAFRYVFLSSDTAWVCCVPTSDVMVKVQQDGSMAVGPESQQYFPADSKAMGLNSVEAIVLGVEEDSLRYRQNEMDLDCTFCIVSRTHMLILECNSPKEARFFCDAWNFFMFYSKPERPPQVPQMKAPVTFGTRGGIKW